MDEPKEYRLLARVPGDILSGGSRMLPNPETDTEEYRDVRLDVQGIGIVQVIYERRLFKHYTHAHHNWLAVHAILVQAPDPVQA